MCRRKLKIAFIKNDAERKASYKKRKKGLLKKLNELTTLCGIDACAVIYNPLDDDEEPEVWPSHFGAQKVVSKFKNLPEIEQSKKMVNQETFMKQRVEKAREKLMKLRRENRRKEVCHMISYCLSGNYFPFNIVDLNDMAFVVNQNLLEIEMRIEAPKEDGVYDEGSGESSNEEKKEQEMSTSGSSSSRTLDLF